MQNNWKRNIILLLTSQVFSMFGTMLVQYAIMWYITLKTQSGVMMTIFIICGFLPTLFLSPFAGVLVDRYNRKKIIILADALTATVTLILAFIFMTGFDGIWLLFVAAAIRSVGGALQMPAVGAFLPQIVPEEQLTRINGINGSLQGIMMLISPIVSAALLKFAKLEHIFFIDVFTAMLAIFILLVFLKTKPNTAAKSEQKVSYLEDMRLGFRYISNHRYLKKLFVYTGVFMFLISPAAFLTPLQVTRSFGEDPWRLAAIEIFFSVGMTLGGILLASWGGFKNRIKTMLLSNFIMALSSIGFGLIPNFWIYLSVMGVMGIALPMFNTPATVLLQEHVEENFLGRVMSVLNMLSSSLMPLGMLIFGPIADLWNIEGILVVSGAILLLYSTLVIRDKNLMEVGKSSQPATE